MLIAYAYLHLSGREKHKVRHHVFEDSPHSECAQCLIMRQDNTRSPLRKYPCKGHPLLLLKARNGCVDRCKYHRHQCPATGQPRLPELANQCDCATAAAKVSATPASA